MPPVASNGLGPSLHPLGQRPEVGVEAFAVQHGLIGPIGGVVGFDEALQLVAPWQARWIDGPVWKVSLRYQSIGLRIGFVRRLGKMVATFRSCSRVSLLR